MKKENMIIKYLEGLGVSEHIIDYPYSEDEAETMLWAQLFFSDENFSVNDDGFFSLLMMLAKNKKVLFILNSNYETSLNLLDKLNEVISSEIKEIKESATLASSITYLFSDELDLLQAELKRIITKKMYEKMSNNEDLKTTKEKIFISLSLKTKIEKLKKKKIDANLYDTKENEDGELDFIVRVITEMVNHNSMNNSSNEEVLQLENHKEADVYEVEAIGNSGLYDKIESLVEKQSDASQVKETHTQEIQAKILRLILELDEKISNQQDNSSQDKQNSSGLKEIKELIAGMSQNNVDSKEEIENLITKSEQIFASFSNKIDSQKEPLSVDNDELINKINVSNEASLKSLEGTIVNLLDAQVQKQPSEQNLDTSRFDKVDDAINTLVSSVDSIQEMAQNNNSDILKLNASIEKLTSLMSLFLDAVKK